MPPLLRPLLILLICLFGHLCLQAEESFTVRTEKNSGITITAVTSFDEIPIAGYAPLRLTVSNNSTRTGHWVITSDNRRNSSSFKSSKTISVPSGSVHEVELLIPIHNQMGNPGHHLYDNVSLYIQGTGISGIRNEYFSRNGYDSSNRKPFFLGLSPTLHRQLIGQLSQPKKGSQKEDALTLLNPKTLPYDWRGYLGWHYLLYEEGDWNSITAKQRQDILRWVAAGGELRILAPDGIITQNSLAPEKHYGLGRLLVFRQSIDEVEKDLTQQEGNGEFFDFLKRSPNTEAILINSQPTDTFSFISGFDNRDSSRFIAIFFLIAFSIIVGPINFIILWKKRRRHLLYLTVPTLSILSSLILIVAIILIDGFGGQGGTVGYSLYLPQQRTVMHQQVQASQTGVLGSKNFQVSDGLVVQPLSNYNYKDKTFSIEGNNHSGDWFESRSQQAQQLIKFEATRSGIEIFESIKGQPPEALSSIPYRLTHFVYRDKHEKLWMAETLETGNRIALKPANPSILNDIWTINTSESENNNNDVTAKDLFPTTVSKFPTTQTGVFFANTQAADAPLLKTHPGISWQQRKHFVMGYVSVRKEGQ